MVTKIKLKDGAYKFKGIFARLMNMQEKQCMSFLSKLKLNYL